MGLRGVRARAQGAGGASALSQRWGRMPKPVAAKADVEVSERLHGLRAGPVGERASGF